LHELAKTAIQDNLDKKTRPVVAKPSKHAVDNLKVTIAADETNTGEEDRTIAKGQVFTNSNLKKLADLRRQLDKGPLAPDDARFDIRHIRVDGQSVTVRKNHDEKRDSDNKSHRLEKHRHGTHRDGNESEKKRRRH
jgi:hypothetical protein